VAFDGTPAVLPESVQPDNWTYEYYPPVDGHQLNQHC